MTNASDVEPTTGKSLSRERVLKEALRMADESGLESLSMRNLARALDVKAMSLYNHVANKEEILDGIVDLAIGEIELPEIGGDWKQAMRQRAISAHEVLLRHPWAALEIVARTNIGPAMLSYIDATLGCLHAAGFSWEMADRAWNAIDSHIYGFTLQELNFPFEVADYADAAQSYIAQIPRDRYPYFSQLASLIIDRSYDGVHDFEFGLELILNGLDGLRKT